MIAAVFTVIMFVLVAYCFVSLIKYHRDSDDKDS